MELWYLTLLFTGICLFVVSDANTHTKPSHQKESQKQPLCNVKTQYNAKGDNKTEDTSAIQAALSSSFCSTVIFPPGLYLTRPLNITVSNQELIIQEGAMLIAWPDPDTWYPHPNSTPALINNHGTVVGLRIYGGGKIDGQGWRWWPFGKTRRRPTLINLAHVTDVLIQNITLIDSPQFNIQIRGNDIRVIQVKIIANNNSCEGYRGAPNTDGINIGGRNIYVADCFVHNGDDCIPTNAGSDGITENVLVERVHCECGTNGGVPIIAANTTIRNVIYQDMTLVGLNQGAGMKISNSASNATGQVVNVTWQRLNIIRPRYSALYTNVFDEDSNHCALPPDPKRAHWLTAINFSFIDIVATNLTKIAPAGCFLCTPGRPCTYNFKNVTITDIEGKPANSYVCGFACSTLRSSSSPVPCGVCTP